MNWTQRLISGGLLLATVLAGERLLAQFNRGRRPPPTSEPPLPTWEGNDRFPGDCFTFVRIKYASRRDWGGWGRGKFWTDAPDSDVNFSYRLQQMTSLRVEPLDANVKLMELTDPRLSDYPFIYIVEPGDLVFGEEEVAALRRYLLNGGFLMVDDFWGEAEGANFYEQIARVLPEHPPVPLELEHAVFHSIFDLREKPQIPSIHHALRFQGTEVTWEREDAKQVDYRGIFDDRGRMMVMVCHNTDLGDGWEQEGASEYYFREFSEKKGYPMGINIVFYAMTH